MTGTVQLLFKFLCILKTYNDLFRASNEFLFVVQIFEFRHKTEHLNEGFCGRLGRLSGKQKVRDGDLRIRKFDQNPTGRFVENRYLKQDESLYDFTITLTVYNRITELCRTSSPAPPISSPTRLSQCMSQRAFSDLKRSSLTASIASPTVARG